MKLKIGTAAGCLAVVIIMACSCRNQRHHEKRILIFSKTIEYRHASIENGIAMFFELGEQQGFQVDTTENPAYFIDDSLSNYNAIVFLSTTGEVLDYAQQSALKRYVEAGGGVMGIHGASGALYSSPWYGKLMGARFKNHPEKLQIGDIIMTNATDPINRGLPEVWKFEEEWYNFDAISPDIQILAKVDEHSYQGGQHGDNHPIYWKQEIDGGRSFYTALGHRPEAYQDSLFRMHILNGLLFVMGNQISPDYNKATTLAAPKEELFVRRILMDSADVAEPMELAVAKDGRIFFIERKGKVKMFDQNSGYSKTIGTIPVYHQYEDGLLGLTLDPDFENNRWIYVMYSSPGELFEYHISRFTLDDDDMINMESEKILLKVHQEHSESNHTGGSLAFDSNGNLYIAIGDNTNPFGDSHGYAPIDERPGRTDYDAQRSSGNTNDLRGKILRIHPQPDGTYKIPSGNLFPDNVIKGRPEVYVMGTRNSFRIAVDSKTSWLYWGDVGPDAGKDSIQGSRGYDEINLAKSAGNYGWPYFIGNNKPYYKVDFTSGKIGKVFDPLAPVNSSPRNTGARILPPTRPALIYYPYVKSEQFPLVGEGGRSAMAGPVYHYNSTLQSDIKLPEYYDKSIFIYDWIRDWVMVIRVDANGNYTGMEPFMPSTGFVKIIDMELGPDGALYILEYGENWYSPNKSARLSKLEYHSQANLYSDSLKKGTDNSAISVKNSSVQESDSPGKILIERSDCRSCHALNEKSVGPSFYEIADKYKSEPDVVGRLINKVIEGGSGVWGQRPMSAHPQLEREDVSKMVEYILSLKRRN